jgi:hypothetical protein
VSGPDWIARRGAEAVGPVASDWVELESTVYPDLQIQGDRNASPDGPDFQCFRHRPRAYTGEFPGDWRPGLPPPVPAPPPPAWHARGRGYWFKWVGGAFAFWILVLAAAAFGGPG